MTHRCSNDCEHAIRATDTRNQSYRGSQPTGTLREWLTARLEQEKRDNPALAAELDTEAMNRFEQGLREGRWTLR